MRACDLHRHAFCEVYAWVEARDPDLAGDLGILARYAHQSVWIQAETRARMWCLAVENGDFASAHGLAAAIRADADTYRPGTRSAA